MIDAIGRYKVQEQIGIGGMGAAYRALDLQHGRTVVIKVLPPAIAGDAATRERFLRDARAAKGVSHPNIAALTEIGDEGDHLYVVFDFVPGETLTKTIGGNPIDPRQAVELAAEIADALVAGHGEGLMHGDLISANVIVTPTGHAKIIDYGMAAWTTSGAGRTDADESTDILGLGALLFEMLTGKRAPKDKGFAPSAHNRSVPVELDPIVRRALAQSAEKRYGSALPLAAELRAVGAVLDVRSDLHDVTHHRSAGAAGSVWTNRSALWIAAAAIVGGLAVAWVTWRR